MKYRDPKTGEVFEDIEEARCKFCSKDCKRCPLNYRQETCDKWATAFPIEAARLMGMEVVEEHGGDATEKLRPRICRVLGGEDHPLEVGEQFTYDGETYLISKAPDGDFLLYNFRSNTAPSGDIMSRMIDHPDRIIRKPRFTQEEVADAKVLMRALGATGLKRNKYEDIYATSDTTADTLLDSEMFPSLYPGQAVKLEDILGGGS